MLSRTTTDRIEVQPGAKGTIELEVSNLRDVIDGISPRVRGLDPAHYSIPVPYVSVFPDAAEKIRVNIELPRSFAAGEHEIVIELRSTVDGGASIDHPMTLVVEPIDDIDLKLSPKAKTGGSKAEFDVELVNKGNTTLDLVVDAADGERTLKVSAEPIFVRVPHGQTASSTITAKKRRPFFGASVRRSITVTAENSDHQLIDTFQFTQKALVPSGVGTILVLGMIVALWALVFMWAINNVFAGDTGTKKLGDGFATTGPVSLDIAGVSGTIDGEVLNAAGEGIPRLTVSAIRAGSDDPAVASVATDDSGRFALPVPPGSYLVQVGGEGYATVDFASGAFDVDPSSPTDAGTLILAGRSGAIRGRIIAEVEEGAPAPTFNIVVRPVVDDVPGEVIDANITIDPDGSYVITGLATPASYELELSAENFAAQRLPAELEGGDDIIVNTISLGAGSGRIEGLVLDGTIPLGNVTVTLTAGDDMLETTTPTTGGDTGRFVFEGLVSPKTYLLTFTRDGYSSESVALQLGPGEAFEADDLQMVQGTGEISGTVFGPGAQPRGGVNVTVVGVDVSIQVQTLTDDPEGFYRIEGLPTPGTYAVTFSGEGFIDTTRVVTLADRGGALGFNATLDVSTITISGIASSGGAPSEGIFVSLSDGLTSRNTPSVAAAAGEPNFIFAGVLPGTYTLTFSDSSDIDAASSVFVLTVGEVFAGQLRSDQNGNLP